MGNNFEYFKGPGDQTVNDDKKIIEILEKKIKEASAKGDEAEIRRCYALIRGRKAETEKNIGTGDKK